MNVAPQKTADAMRTAAASEAGRLAEEARRIRRANRRRLRRMRFVSA